MIFEKLKKVETFWSRFWILESRILTFDDVEIDQAKDYAAEDADVTYRLYKKYLKDIKEEKLVNIYESFEKPMIEILAKMEISGIKLDKDFLLKLSKKFEKKIAELEKEIF